MKQSQGSVNVSVRANMAFKNYKVKLFDCSGAQISIYSSAIDPVTHNTYLLSTRDNKCMVIFNRYGELKSLRFIDIEVMPQPEDVCFSPERILSISTERKKEEPSKVFASQGR